MCHSALLLPILLTRSRLCATQHVHPPLCLYFLSCHVGVDGAGSVRLAHVPRGSPVAQWVGITTRPGGVEGLVAMVTCAQGAGAHGGRGDWLGGCLVLLLVATGLFLIKH